MSTHMPGFQSFFRFFASFHIGQISHLQHKGFRKSGVKEILLRYCYGIPSHELACRLPEAPGMCLSG